MRQSRKRYGRLSPRTSPVEVTTILTRGGPACRWLDSVAEEFLSVDFKATLHTFNRKHYEPIPGISLIQPYKKG